jgi:co-chaperonin GroES (HSP10)
MTSLANMKKVSLLDESLDSAFPPANPGVIPYGHRVLVQLKSSALKTVGGIILSEDATQTEFDNTKVAKVVAVGPGAFRSRDTNEIWPEGAWAKVGDYVRIPLHTNSQNSWTVAYKDTRIGFAIIDDLQLLGEQPDPFYIKAFL